MTAVLLSILLLACFVPVLVVMASREQMIQYPFLASAVVLGWVLPQLVALASSSILPGYALEKTIFFTTLCLIAIYAGYYVNQRPAGILQWELSKNRMLIGAAILSAAGAFFFLKVSQLAAEADAEHGGQWTGPITIYVFLASMLSTGFVVALVTHLHRPNIFSLSIIMFDLAFYLHRVVIQGRRAAIAELATMALFALWFRYRWLPPRTVVFIGVFAGSLIVNSIGDYRATVLDRDAEFGWSGAGVSDVLAIDFLGNLENKLTDPLESQEMINAALTIEATEILADYDYGLSLWNNLVFSFVPAQLLGADFKQSLLIPVINGPAEVFRHTPWPGTTLTGMADAFQSFWYLGALKFALIGFIMSRWYRAAALGVPSAQIIVMLVTVPAMHGITHNTHWFFAAFVPLVAFLLPILAFSRCVPVPVPKIEPAYGPA